MEFIIFLLVVVVGFLLVKLKKKETENAELIFINDRLEISNTKKQGIIDKLHIYASGLSSAGKDVCPSCGLIAGSNSAGSCPDHCVPRSNSMYDLIPKG